MAFLSHQVSSDAHVLLVGMECGGGESDPAVAGVDTSPWGCFLSGALTRSGFPGLLWLQAGSSKLGRLCN